MAVPRLEETSLRALAAAGGGRYATLTSDDRDLEYLLSGEVGARSASDDGQATDQWREEGPWLLLLLLPLAAMAFRRGWVLLVLVVILPLSPTAEASLWDDLWRNKDQQAKQLLDAGETAAAAELFKDEQWRAVSKYRAGEYATSAAEFTAREDSRNLYNLGNALARQGEFESALDAYEQVIGREPGNEDAIYNRELVKQALEQQQQQQEGEQQESSESSGEQGDNAENSADPNQETSGNSDADGESGEDSPSDQAENEATEEQLEALQQELKRAAEEAKQQNPAEQQLSDAELAELRRQQAEEQAMEQWLRRIPNDPGGLLRRKFRYQYQKMGKDQDGNNLWPDNEEQPW
jgi:Ca-activated chloride channel family protein